MLINNMIVNNSGFFVLCGFLKDLYSNEVYLLKSNIRNGCMVRNMNLEKIILTRYLEVFSLTEKEIIKVIEDKDEQYEIKIKKRKRNLFHDMFELLNLVFIRKRLIGLRINDSADKWELIELFETLGFELTFNLDNIQLYAGIKNYELLRDYYMRLDSVKQL